MRLPVFPDPRVRIERDHGPVEQGGDVILVFSDGEHRPTVQTVQSYTAAPVRVVRMDQLDTVQSARVLLLFGYSAAEMVLGQGHNALRLRRGYGWLSSDVPVHLLPTPGHVAGNRFKTAEFRADLEWAVKGRPAPPPTDATYRMVRTVADAREAYDALNERHLVYDCETFGRMWCAPFRIAVLGVATRGSRHVWVWGDDALRPGDPRREWAVAVLQNARTLSGTNVKYDYLSAEVYLGLRIRKDQSGDDTFPIARLLRSDHDAGLEPTGSQFGIFGHKAEMSRAIGLAKNVLSRLREAVKKPVVVGWVTEERVNEKTGKLQRRQVVGQTRPPTPAEERSAALAKLRDLRAKDWAAAAKGPTVPKKRQDPDAVAEAEAKWQAACAKLARWSVLSTDEADWVQAAVDRDTSPMAYVYGLIDQRISTRYCASDVLVSSVSVDPLCERLQRALPDSWRVYQEIVRWLPYTATRIESVGLPVDIASLTLFERALDDTIRDTLAKIHEIAPGLNPGSDQQLAEVLYKKLGLPKGRKTKTGYSTDADEMRRLKDAHPIIPLIAAYKAAVKMQSNYARGLRQHIRDDGRVHCTYNIAGAESGRWSCSEPNMQTMPSRNERAPHAKRIYRAPPGYKWVVADFSTLEPRVGALLSGDAVMGQAFREGVDFHNRTRSVIAPLMWGGDLPDDEAHADEQARRRKIAKTVGLAVMYGQGPETMAEGAKCTVDEAERAQAALLAGYRDFGRWIQARIVESRRTGVTWTYWAGKPARRRVIHDIGHVSRDIQGHGERCAYNTPIQGSGAEYCSASCVGVVDLVEETGVDAELALTVHDSLAALVAVDDVDEFAAGLKRVMESWWSGDVPIRADVEVGDTLADLVEWVPPDERQAA